MRQSPLAACEAGQTYACAGRQWKEKKAPGWGGGRRSRVLLLTLIASLATLSFSPGETIKTITVSVKGELLTEPNETLFLNLSGAVNATISDAQGLGTIINDD